MLAQTPTATPTPGANPTGAAPWMPPQASTVAAEVDMIFNLVLWISAFFFVLIVGLMILFIIRFRSKDPNEMGPPIHHNNTLEVIWTAIPVVLVAIIFWLGFKGYMNQVTPPSNTYEIQVTGQQWKWLFTYPNGYIAENLHVPIGEPVSLLMTSDDVIHSLFIPAFRVKMDVFPGRYSKLWFTAIEPGTYPLYCAEYCGTEHSSMLAQVVVHPVGEFEPWLETESNILATMTPEDGGQHLYNVRGCVQCHSLDGSARIGPSLQGLFGKNRVFQDGTTAVADENYIRESLLDPQARMVAGFEPVMPTQQGRLKDEEIAAIIAFIKSISTEQ